MAIKVCTGTTSQPYVHVQARLSQAATITATGLDAPLVTDATGLVGGTYSISLWAASDLTPTGTYYTVTEFLGSTDNTFNVQVPNSAGPFTMTSILVGTPTASPSPNHVSTLIVDGTSGVAINAAGDVAARSLTVSSSSPYSPDPSGRPATIGAGSLTTPAITGFTDGLIGRDLAVAEGSGSAYITNAQQFDAVSASTRWEATPYVAQSGAGAFWGFGHRTDVITAPAVDVITTTAGAFYMYSHSENSVGQAHNNSTNQIALAAVASATGGAGIYGFNANVASTYMGATPQTVMGIEVDITVPRDGAKFNTPSAPQAVGITVVSAGVGLGSFVFSCEGSGAAKGWGHGAVYGDVKNASITVLRGSSLGASTDTGLYIASAVSFGIFIGGRDLYPGTYNPTTGFAAQPQPAIGIALGERLATSGNSNTLRFFSTSAASARQTWDLLATAGDRGLHLQWAGADSFYFTAPDTGIEAKLVSQTTNQLVAYDIYDANTTLEGQLVYRGDLGAGSRYFAALSSNADFMAVGTLNNKLFEILTNSVVRLTVPAAGGLTFADANNIAVGTATGTKVGTATNQKLGFFNAAPVIQPATTGTATGFTANAGTAVQDASTFTGGTGATAYRISDVVLALKQLGLLAA